MKFKINKTENLSLSAASLMTMRNEKILMTRSLVAEMLLLVISSQLKNSKTVFSLTAKEQKQVFLSILTINLYTK